jgi:hypothetical protein
MSLSIYVTLFSQVLMKEAATYLHRIAVRVIRNFCEKIAQNVAETVFCQVS